jgi:hypothetical protein
MALKNEILPLGLGFGKSDQIRRPLGLIHNDLRFPALTS